MSKHANISVFVAHVGCSHRCSFCDQRSITGENSLPKGEDIDKAVKIAMSSPKYSPENTEIAFFGGSFTAINYEYMTELLSSAYKYVESKKVKGIRVSTRPDAIDISILNVLKNYGVTAIELGAQSMDEDVLHANKRGHSAEAVYNASSLIKEYGFSLGLQMMTGLYGSTKEKDRKTVDEFIKIHPDTVRIYPTIILKNTALAHLYEKGEYIPFSLEETVEQCCDYYEAFTKSGIEVIRMGLHHINEEDYVAGPWHPAFSQLCTSRMCYDHLYEELKTKPKGEYKVYVALCEISDFVGQKRENILKLKEKGYVCSIHGDTDLITGQFRIEGIVK